MEIITSDHLQIAVQDATHDELQYEIIAFLCGSVVLMTLELMKNIGVLTISQEKQNKMQFSQSEIDRGQVAFIFDFQSNLTNNSLINICGFSCKTKRTFQKNTLTIEDRKIFDQNQGNNNMIESNTIEFFKVKPRKLRISICASAAVNPIKTLFNPIKVFPRTIYPLSPGNLCMTQKIEFWNEASLSQSNFEKENFDFEGIKIIYRLRRLPKYGLLVRKKPSLIKQLSSKNEYDARFRNSKIDTNFQEITEFSKEDLVLGEIFYRQSQWWTNTIKLNDEIWLDAIALIYKFPPSGLFHLNKEFFLAIQSNETTRTAFKKFVGQQVILHSVSILELPIQISLEFLSESEEVLNQLINRGPTKVKEGENVTLSELSLNAYNLLYKIETELGINRAVLGFQYIKPFSYGTILFKGEPLNVGYGSFSFSQIDINKGSLIYIHDDSETRMDSCEILIQLYRPINVLEFLEESNFSENLLQKRSSTYNFEKRIKRSDKKDENLGFELVCNLTNLPISIEIQPVNDNPLEKVEFNNPIKLVEGDRATLLFKPFDPDNNSGDIHYLIIPSQPNIIGLGKLINSTSGRSVSNFSQIHIEKGEIVYLANSDIDWVKIRSSKNQNVSEVNDKSIYLKIVETIGSSDIAIDALKFTASDGISNILEYILFVQISPLILRASVPSNLELIQSYRITNNNYNIVLIIPIFISIVMRRYRKLKSQ